MLRSLAREIRQFPATMTIGALWIAVFVLMIVSGLRHSQSPSIGQIFLIGLGGGHRFGDLTLRELFHGEAWRTVTCTFIHYGFLHISMNLFGLYQLGSLVESWYGSAQFLAIYVLIGSGGNLLAGLVRHFLGSNPDVHSGGGSTVLMGLVGLCAVVGWRSRTRVGEYLQRQMVLVLVITGLLGVVILGVTWLLGQMRPIIDNWGHAGGALVGAAIGFAHRPLVQASQRRVARWAGAIAVLLLVICGAAQFREDRVEDRQKVQAIALFRWKAAEQTFRNLLGIQEFYRLAAQRADFERSRFVNKSLLAPPRGEPEKPLTDPFTSLTRPDAAFRADLKSCLGALDAARGELGTGPAAADYQRFRTLLERVLTKPPTQLERDEFLIHFIALIKRAQQNLKDAKAQFEAISRQGATG